MRSSLIIAVLLIISSAEARFLTQNYRPFVQSLLSNISDLNRCGANDVPGNIPASNAQCGGSDGSELTCCCEDQVCEGNQWWKGCVTKQPNYASIGIMTHYWDCCKPSCAWPGSAPFVTRTCDKTGVFTSTDINQQSVCDDNVNGSATCRDQAPWINEDGVLYGFGAVGGDPKTDHICGTCVKLQFGNPRRNGPSEAIIMVTNGGGSVGNNVDLLVPGGGFGDFTGCQNMDGWNVYTQNGGPCQPYSDTDNCAVYGGFKHQSHCDSAFSHYGSKRACNEILFGAFGQIGCNHDAGYPPNLDIVSRIDNYPCPDSLKEKAGIPL